MFANYAKMSNLNGVVQSSAALLRSDLSNLNSLGLILWRGGSGADRGGTISAEVFDSNSVGLDTSYCLRYAFPDQVPLTRTESSIRTICSSLELVSKLVEVSCSPVSLSPFNKDGVYP